MNLYITKIPKNASAEYSCINQLSIKGCFCASQKTKYPPYQNILEFGAHSCPETEVVAIGYLDGESCG